MKLDYITRTSSARGYVTSTVTKVSKHIKTSRCSILATSHCPNESIAITKVVTSAVISELKITTALDIARVKLAVINDASGPLQDIQVLNESVITTLGLTMYVLSRSLPCKILT